MTDRIEKTIDLAAPVERVWAAIADSAQFGAWFRVAFDQPFAAGQPISGPLTEGNFEHLTLTMTVEAIEPPHRFAFSWHPHAVDPAIDYSAEPTTLVEFTLDPIPTGTRLTVSESGFDRIPEHRRATAVAMNGQGWAIQLERIRTYVGG